MRERVCARWVTHQHLESTGVEAEGKQRALEGASKAGVDFETCEVRACVKGEWWWGGGGGGVQAK